MTSYLSSLTSHYTTLKRLLPNSLSADSDLHINDPEDSHLSRVLRAYYTEKGRPFPPWLGPDPNQPVQPKPAFVQQASNGYGQPLYGQPPPPQQQAGAGFRNSRGNNSGGLGDLFDSPRGGGGGPPPPKDEPLSLRSRRRLQPSAPEPQSSARPLPSQRAGSHQSRGSVDPEPQYNQPPPPASREQSAQARLRARLGANRSNSPANSTRSDGGSPDPYGRAGGGGGGGNPYGGSGRSGNPYGGPPDPYGGGGGRRAVTSANAPWSSGDDPYGGGGHQGRGYERGPGLPSNPRRR